MMTKISIMSGKPLLKINQEYRNLHSDATIVMGNLINESLFERKITPSDRKLWKKRKDILQYFSFKSKLETPVYHCYGSDRYDSIEGSYIDWDNYHAFYHLKSSLYISGFKVIGISGFYKSQLKSCKEGLKAKRKNLYFFDSSIFTKITNDEPWCDILLINSMIENNIIVFPKEFYDMVFHLKPKLIVIGGLNKLQLKKFPLTDIDLLLIGRNDHIVYDVNDKLIFRKLS